MGPATDELDALAIALRNGVMLPRIGLGLWQVPDDAAERAVRQAIAAGYRNVDTAAYYSNESGVGRAIRGSGIARDEVFVTSKIWLYDQGHDRTLRAFDASARRLGLEYVDLYLVHCPFPGRDLDTWRACERLLADGRVRAIGVANFGVEHLTRLIDNAALVPAVNQVELHPYHSQSALRALHTEHGIVTQAWSPLRQARELLDDPIVRRLAAKHARTPAQVVLRWHVQLGNAAIPKSVTPTRIVENLGVADWELDPDDMTALTTLDSGRRIGPDEGTFDFAKWRPPRRWRADR